MKPRSTPRLYFEGGGSEGPRHSLGSKKSHFLENTSLCGGDTDHIRTRPLYTFSFHDSVNSHIYVMLTTGSVVLKCRNAISDILTSLLQSLEGSVHLASYVYTFIHIYSHHKIRLGVP